MAEAMTVPQGYSVHLERPKAFYPVFERKGELQTQTHYCPGCGHGTAHKLIAEAIDELGIQDRAVAISPVGCGVFAYYYFDTGNVQAAHGRASAVATAVKRSRPEAIVFSYQGDGDLAAIGSAEILHAANRGENITVFFVNNGIYGMTGGQMAPTTLLGQKTTTSPLGRNPQNEGFPVRVCEILSSLDAPVYLERVALGNPKQVQTARRAIQKALRNQMEGKGFSLVEIVSPCPTIWKMTPEEAQKHVREGMLKTFPPGVYRDRSAETEPRPQPTPPPAMDELHRLLNIEDAAAEPFAERPNDVDLRIKVAGFGGQGVLMLGEVLAEAGLLLDLEVSWLPSYGPEMRSGTSNCHVRIGSKPIDSPLVAKPNVLLALNEPSLRKFLHTVEPGGWVIYNGVALPEELCAPDGVHVLALPCAELADGLGASKVGNIVMLGALLEATRCLPEEAVDHALRAIVKSERWLALDRQAIHLGWAEAEKGACHAIC